MFVKQVSKDIAALRAYVGSGEWVPAQKLSHKLRGTATSVNLDCATGATALDAALKRQIRSGGDGVEARALCAEFLTEVDAVVAFFALEC